jgi:Outer membrane lipoprotein-sorting protein
MKSWLAVFAWSLLAAAGAFASTTNALSDAEIQGHNLARQLLEQWPVENFTNTGVLQIRDGKGKTSEIPIKFETIVTKTNWSGVYELSTRDFVTNAPAPIKLVVLHDSSNSNHYSLTSYSGGDPKWQWTKDQSDVVAASPFAGDFRVADLGLEFFHWPEQKILKHEMRRGRSCRVLESANPSPSMNGCSRVVSWIDNESGGIVHAEAYDAKNKLLKEFDPKSFKKVNGQWELQDMEIRNVQTGSRTRLEFDLKAQ